MDETGATTIVSPSSTAISTPTLQNSTLDAEVKHYVKELLKSRIFLGRYVERRLVDKRVGYRDIIILSPAETELKKDLLDAEHRLRSLNKFHWIGITYGDILNLPISDICLWTEIDNQPFGVFWLQVKTVQLKNSEVIIKLKCIRHISDKFLEAEPILAGEVKSRTSKNFTLENSTESLPQTFSDIKDTLKTALTVTNVKEFLTFLAAFVIAVFTGGSAFINFLGTFILALIREMSIFVKNSTPMFLGVLEFLSKCVGGFYILLAMFFKPSRPERSDRRRVAYYESPEENNYDAHHRDID